MKKWGFVRFHLHYVFKRWYTSFLLRESTPEEFFPHVTLLGGEIFRRDVGQQSLLGRRIEKNPTRLEWTVTWVWGICGVICWGNDNLKKKIIIIMNHSSPLIISCKRLFVICWGNDNLKKIIIIIMNHTFPLNISCKRLFAQKPYFV